LIYIGESDDVGTRLKQHNRPEDKGGKDFWEKVCLVTSKDQNLTKAHVKYLESLLIQSAGQIGRCRLMNGTAHEYISLPESDRADMAFFAEQIRTVLPVLGLDFLRETARPSREPEATLATEPEVSPHFTLEVPRHGIRATSQEIDGEFYVFKGSLARGAWAGTERGYQSLYNQLCEDGVLTESNGTKIFNVDQSFNSPSAAAAVVSGRSANGRTSWKTEESGLTYGDWQDQQVSEAVREASK
jgi:hypothetical protein